MLQTYAYNLWNITVTNFPKVFYNKIIKTNLFLALGTQLFFCMRKGNQEISKKTLLTQPLDSGKRGRPKLH